MNSPLKYHGGKHYLAQRIIALMPKHTHYVEPFAGSLAVLLAKDPEGVSEVAGDIYGYLMNFWKTLQCATSAQVFISYLWRVPFSQAEFERARERLQAGCENHAIGPDSHCVGCAINFFICARQSMAGRMQSFAPRSRSRTRRGMNEQVSAWLSAIEGLAEVHERLQRVVILNQDALTTIKQEDSEHTLFYLDPPYVQQSRTAPEVYEHEMSLDQHLDLLNLIRTCKGKVMISGYPSEVYDQTLRGWRVERWEVANHAAGTAGSMHKQKPVMTECVWMNF